VREIRMLRSTRRGLETRHGRDAVTLADERARQQETQTSTYTSAPVLDPTDERGWETGCWPQAPSYRAYPRLYQVARSMTLGDGGLWRDNSRGRRAANFTIDPQATLGSHPVCRQLSALSDALG
jgi:hypothetical protein